MYCTTFIKKLIPLYLTVTGQTLTEIEYHLRLFQIHLTWNIKPFNKMKKTPNSTLHIIYPVSSRKNFLRYVL